VEPAAGSSPPVPLQDLTAHHEPILPELAAAAVRVLTSGRFIAGAETEAFEREVAAALSIPHAVGVSSGTDGLLAALMACGVGPGDEVVTTPFSFFASVGAILRLGATPVFADVDPATLNLDPTAAAARLGPRTRAVLVVHLFGRAARFDGLEVPCAARDIPIVEDAAQAIGARADRSPQISPGISSDISSDARPVGALGRCAVLSFFPSKNLGGFGDGGMVLTTDADFAARIRVLRVHGATAKNRHEVLGGNFRLDELQAALLRVKLPHLPRWTERRRHIADHYRQCLGSLEAAGAIDLPPADTGSVWNQFVVRVRDRARDPLRQHLAGRGIATAIYYPTPLHLQPALAQLGWRAGAFPHAESAAAEVLALPIYPELSLADADRVVAAVAAFFRRAPEVAR
jgi:dTDP-4-amino-4,6-dideoxygalactose transaminase